MPFTVTMPKLSPTMEEGTIAKWRVKEGERVAAGDVMLEVATDKATVEHGAIDEGYLRKILVPEGQAASVNQPIAIFTESADESIEGYEPEGEGPKEPTPPKIAEEEGPEKQLGTAPPQGPQEPGGLKQPQFVPFPPLEDYQFEKPTGPFRGKIPASPLARKLAERKGVDLASVKGSGPHGRIVSRDIETAAPSGILALSRGHVPEMAPGSYEEEPLSQMRKVVGKRLQESKSFIPHFYVTQEMDAAPMARIREELKSGGMKVTFNDLIVRATALALRQHPEINSGFNSANQSLIRFKTIDVAVAVSLPEGLITPIIRHTDYKSIETIASEVKLLAQKAREGQLAPEEFQGGSFTISNLGMFGVRDFIAVINPPQAAILAIGGIAEKPLVRGGRVEVGRAISMTLSADHRVVDGADAARFLATLKNLIESPALLIV